MKRIFLISLTILVMTNGFSQSYKDVNTAKGLPVGSKAPLFNAMDADSSTFVLADELKKGPVVVIFYRGHWCPVCNKHLSQIQDSLSLITEMGATVIAISPEKPEYLEKMEEKSGIKFRLLYDEEYKISDAYDVTFLPDSKQIFVYNTMLNAKLKETHSDDSQRLPIPATYIINKEGKIVWRQFDPNYKNRSSIREILDNLPL
ncbi:MAG: peroxiredoxin-like family protein [Bacteroidales bacterium]|jgi:peroxiredoxin|nr:peroxiredoxin-like family protein [Bacteroidales bacterium]